MAHCWQIFKHANPELPTEMRAKCVELLICIRHYNVLQQGVSTDAHLCLTELSCSVLRTNLPTSAKKYGSVSEVLPTLRATQLANHPPLPMFPSTPVPALVSAPSTPSNFGALLNHLRNKSCNYVRSSMSKTLVSLPTSMTCLILLQNLSTLTQLLSALIG